jgi:hypothetical protein
MYMHKLSMAILSDSNKVFDTITKVFVQKKVYTAAVKTYHYALEVYDAPEQGCGENGAHGRPPCSIPAP